MATHQTCLKCGAPLAAGAGKDFCPKCLFLQASAGLLDQEEPGARVQESEFGAPTSADTEELENRKSAIENSLGDYELLEEIGRGGMGVVYRARQRSLDRFVAIKMMAFGPGSSPELVKRFRAEAISAAALQHPNIVAIHEVGIHEGRHFFVMDYVEGQSLAQLARNAPLPSRRAASYLKIIAEAVHYAHERGILHRDLKPSNVLIDAQDQPRVVDFGLARRLEGASELTVTGQVLGSPNYLPPEQAAVQRGRVSRRTDVYGLGATLYHLLTGRPPFQAETFSQTLDLVLHADPVAPRLLNPSVPRDLETVCLKCLEKEPAKRYATAQLLAEELDRFLNGQPVVARPVGAAGKTWRWCRRNPALAATGTVAVLAVVLGFTGVLWQWSEAVRQGQIAKASTLSTLQHIYAADMDRAQRSLEENDFGRAVSLLNRYRPDTSQLAANSLQPSTDLRQWEWRYLWQLCQSDESSMLCQYPNSWVGGLAVSPDGRWLPIQTGDSVAMWDLRNKRELWTRPASGWRGTIAFSPTDSLVAVANYDATALAEVKLHDVTTGAARALLKQETPVKSLAWSSDGRLLATMDSKGTISLRFLEPNRGTDSILTSSTKAVHRVPEGNYVPSTNGSCCLAFSPDGALLAFGDVRGCVRLYDWRTGRITLEIPRSPKEGVVTTLAFSQDGQFLAWGVSEKMTIHLWDRVAGMSAGELVGHQDWILSLAFTADSKLLASASGDQTVRIWSVADKTESRRLQGHLNEVWAAVFLPDGKTLVSGGKDGSVRCWDAAAPPDTPWHRTVPARQLAFTTNSQQFVAVGQDGSVSNWDAVSLKPIEALPEFGSNNCSVTLSPDGRWLAVGDAAGQVKIWNWPAKRAITNLASLATTVDVLGFSPRGAFLWAGVSRTGSFRRTGKALRAAKVWHTSSWEEVPLRGIDVTDVCWMDFSADDRLLATAHEDGTVKLWSFPDSRHVRTLTGHSPEVANVQFSPTGRILASAGYDDFVKLWDMRSNQELMTLRSHFNHLHSIAFSPDGRRLAIAGLGPKAAVKLWDPTTQRELITLRVDDSNASVSYLTAFSPDGNTLIWTIAGGPVHLWYAPSFAEIAERERKLAAAKRAEEP